MKYYNIYSISFFLLVLFYSPIICAQITISGTIKDKSEMPIPQVSLIAYNIPDSVILGFGISDSKGIYNLNVKPTSGDSIYMVARSMGYHTQGKLVVNQNQKVDLILLHNDKMLEEINIKANPVSAEGDTLIYNVSSFAKVEDRVLEDILKKMPGIKVSANGQISYQGRPINKLYIEGKDLLESKYMMATQNIPHESVASVEVMKNHQPIKMLQDVVHSVDPAINIVLKSGIVLTGTSEVGAGIPSLWHGKVAPMLFSKKHQMVNEFISSNTGNDYLNKFFAVNLFDYLDFGENIEERHHVLLGSTPFASSLFKKKDYNFNQSHSGSTNYLTSLGKAEIKFNIDAFYQERTQEKSINQEFFTSEQVIQFSQHENLNYINKMLSPTVTIEKNNKDTYLKNSFKLKLYEENELLKSELNSQKIIQESRRLFYSFKNTLSNIFKIKNSYYRIVSYLEYTHEPQNLVLDTNLFILPLELPRISFVQNLVFNNFKTYTGSSLIHKWKNVTSQTKFGIGYYSKQLNTDIDSGNEFTELPEFQNNLTFRKFIPEVIPQLSYKKNKFFISFTPKISYQYLTLNKPNTNRINRVFLLPSMLLKQKLNHLTIRLNISENISFLELPNIYQGYIINDFRSITQKDIDILSTKAQSLGSAIEYEFADLSLFMNLNFNYQRTIKDWITYYDIDENGGNALEVVAFENNQGLTKSIGFSGDVLLLGLNTNVRLDGKINLVEENAFLNQKLTSVNSINQQFLIETETSLGNNISFKIYNQYSQQKNEYNNNFSASFNQNILGFNFNLSKQEHSISVNNRYISHSRATKQFLYTDFIYRFNFKKKRAQLEFSCQNIFNHNQYVQTTFTAQSNTTIFFPLRPRQILALVKFHFGS